MGRKGLSVLGFEVTVRAVEVLVIVGAVTVLILTLLCQINWCNLFNMIVGFVKSLTPWWAPVGMKGCPLEDLGIPLLNQCFP